MNELPERARYVAKNLHEEGIAHPVVDALVKEISDRAGVCRKDFGFQAGG